MKGKVGSVDGAIRTVLGLLILLIGHHERSWWGLMGFVPMLTAIIGFCPLYWVTGLDTRTRDEIDPAHGAH
jgi:hypothetical protein